MQLIALNFISNTELFTFHKSEFAVQNIIIHFFDNLSLISDKKQTDKHVNDRYTNKGHIAKLAWLY